MIAQVMLLGVLSICFNSNLEFLSGKLNSMDFLIRRIHSKFNSKKFLWKIKADINLYLHRYMY